MCGQCLVESGSCVESRMGTNVIDFAMGCVSGSIKREVVDVLF